MLSTLIPVILLATVFVTAFLLFRVKYKRIYQPRSYLGTLGEHQRSPKLSDSKFGWFSQFMKIPDEYVLSHNGIDGYFFLRFFKMLVIICAVGWPLTWAILMSVYGTSHAAQMQFNKISFSNIDTSVDGNRLYAVTFVAWLYYGGIIFCVAREAVYYLHVRQAYLLLPAIAGRLSSKTVLFTNVPTDYLNEARLRETFSSIIHVWLPTDCKDLDELVDDRNSTAMKLEGAEVKLSKTANDKRLKAEKKNAKQDGDYLTQKDRPTHKLGKFGLYGKKVDTIDWCRTHLAESKTKVEAERETHLSGKAKFSSAVFIEFANVQAAQAAYHKTHVKAPKGFVPRATGSTPSEVIWKNLNMGNTQRLIRTLVVSGIIAAMIIFWLVITAFIGLVSNLKFLESKAPFLKFLDKLGPVSGIITNLLPAVALAVALMLVPIIMRVLFKLAGSVTVSEVELRTQTWYFVFQVIQVFLVTTLASGATGSVSQILNTPSQAPKLLATGLPTASNFYISYIIVYGLSGAAGALLNIGGLVVSKLLGMFLDTTPRKKFNRYLGLSGLQWGSIFPVYTNIGVIVIVYSCIAPLILGFATIGLGLLYIAFRYNMIYCQDSMQTNTEGRAFAKAIQQLTTGVYIGVVCLVGLFSIATASTALAAGPLALMIVFLVVIAVFHFLLNRALSSLEKNISHELDTEMEAPTNGETKATEPRLPSANVDNKMANMLVKLLRVPAVPTFDTYLMSRSEDYMPEIRREAYLNPSIWKPTPKLWIVHDEMGISTREISETSKVIEISDAGAWFDAKGKVTTVLSDADEKDDANLAKTAYVWEDPVHY